MKLKNDCLKSSIRVFCIASCILAACELNDDDDDDDVGGRIIEGSVHLQQVDGRRLTYGADPPTVRYHPVDVEGACRAIPAGTRLPPTQNCLEQNDQSATRHAVTIN